MGVGEVRDMALEVEEAEARWEKLLLRTPVRVLLVESDDSTRQIIAALLRKCGYRVAAASDGLKAWLILKEKVQLVDIVLTDVELRNISGIELLIKIMNDRILRHIPVIMMSSNDSISTVLKCMMEGASDFLVKPIRKNELTNIWQHVWRKQKLSCENESIGYKSENHPTKRLKIELENNLLLLEKADHKQDDREYYEKESDSQSSCTRSDMDHESKCKMKDKVKFKGSQHQGVVTLDANMQLEGNLNRQELNQDKFSSGMFHLVEANNDQSQHSCNEKSLSNCEANLLGNINLKQNSSSTSIVDLSLEGYHDTVSSRQANDESNSLHHSNSSAFSLYDNSSRGALELSKLTNVQSQHMGSSDSSIELSHDPSVSNPLQYNELNSKPEETKPFCAALPRQDRLAFQSTPIQLIPILVPVGSMPFNAPLSNSFIHPLFYPQSFLPFWSTMPSMMQDAFYQYPFHQSTSKDYKPLQNHPPEDYCHNTQNFQTHHSQEESTEPVNEQRHVSISNGDTNIIGRDTGCHLNQSEPSGVHHGSHEHVTTMGVSEASVLSVDEEGSHTDVINSEGADCFSQRQAALAKFRLKRKDRCYAKKVRYVSRQRLAKQRPRVKGQFVRQV
ncbi:hypothetical protein HPP92_025202 [Vanilla planifolia]|uniref:Uncharacterized protein n=1 Tax=Vanilla planifolia TaxID=51239 RepID=A0A835PJN3_VANPL|nr:hypothetical protein HPP92_025202 [Vanilla planifolia]